MVSWHPNVQHPTRRKRDQKSPETQSHDQNSVLTCPNQTCSPIQNQMAKKNQKYLAHISYIYFHQVPQLLTIAMVNPLQYEALDFQVSCATLGAPKFVSSALLKSKSNWDLRKKHTSTFAKKRARTLKALWIYKGQPASPVVEMTA